MGVCMTRVQCTGVRDGRNAVGYTRFIHSWQKLVHVIDLPAPCRMDWSVVSL